MYLHLICQGQPCPTEFPCPTDFPLTRHPGRTGRMVFASAADRELVVREFKAIEGGHQTLGRLAGYLAKMR